MDKHLEVSHLIDGILDEHNISQRDLAKVLGISKEHINKLYNGNANCSKVLIRLIKIVHSHRDVFIKLRKISEALCLENQ